MLVFTVTNEKLRIIYKYSHYYEQLIFSYISYVLKCISNGYWTRSLECLNKLATVFSKVLNVCMITTMEI